MSSHVRFLQTMNVWLSLKFPKLMASVTSPTSIRLLALADESFKPVDGCFYQYNDISLQQIY